MELMIDTANLAKIKQYNASLPLMGVTTNPSIIKKEGKIDYFAHMCEIREIIGKDKSLHAQVVGQDVEGMLQDAETILTNVDRDVYIKVPVTEAGLTVIKALKAKGVHVTATAIYSKFQAYLAIAAGADYIAPYFNRMENQGINSTEAIFEMAEEIARTGSSTKILAASFKNVRQVNDSIENGAQAVTVGADVLAQGLGLTSVAAAVDDFQKDWESVFGEGETVSSIL